MQWTAQLIIHSIGIHSTLNWIQLQWQIGNQVMDRQRHLAGRISERLPCITRAKHKHELRVAIASRSSRDECGRNAVFPTPIIDSLPFQISHPKRLSLAANYRSENHRNEQKLAPLSLWACVCVCVCVENKLTLLELPQSLASGQIEGNDRRTWWCRWNCSKSLTITSISYTRQWKQYSHDR